MLMDYCSKFNTLYSIKQKHTSRNTSLPQIPGINLKNYSMKKVGLFRQTGMVQQKQNRRSRKRQRQRSAAYPITTNSKTAHVFSRGGLRRNGYYLPGLIDNAAEKEAIPNAPDRLMPYSNNLNMPIKLSTWALETTDSFIGTVSFYM